jgi:hypothetical protein
MSGTKLVILSCCHQLESDPGAIGRRMRAAGAQAVIGYSGVVWYHRTYGAGTGMTWLDARLWLEPAGGTYTSADDDTDDDDGGPTAAVLVDETGTGTGSDEQPMDVVHALTQTVRAWENTWGRLGHSKADWGVDTLTCLDNTCIQPAF